MSGAREGNSSLIEVIGLEHSYNDHPVLKLDKWSLKKGEKQLLLGPSGSGKTTLLSILAGLLKPSAGQVTVGGKSLSDLSPRELDKYRASTVGLVFQDHHLISSMTVEDNLMLAQYFAGQKADRTWFNHLLVRLGIAEKRKCKPSTLSRGEAQRAALARAAICRPPIMIADEPTSALDDENTALVASLFTDLCKEWGATLLIASHDARIKPFFAEHLALSGQGKVAA